jgi:polysaccharide biosynthesis/export protein
MDLMLRFVKSCTTAIIVFGCTVGFAEALSNDSFRIGPGDKLRITVIGEGFESQILSGEFHVGNDGSIEYPFVGSMAVSGKLPTEIGSDIKTALGSQIQLAIVPSVTVTSYAPVFLLGDIPKSGMFPYEPDLTVLKLVLMAGGLPKIATDEARLMGAEQDFAELELTRFAYLVERARLLAEVRQTDFNTKDIARPVYSQVDVIVANETERFESGKRSRQSQLKSYETQLQTFDRQIESLKKGIDLQDQEVRLLEDEMNTQQGLSEKGLVARVRVADVKREYILLQRQALDERTALFRAQQDRLNAEQRLIEQRALAETTNWARLNQIAVELGKTEIRLGTSTKTLDSLRQETPVLKAMFGRVPTYTVLRHTEGAYVESEATEQTRLARGDILKVEFLRKSKSAMPIDQASEANKLN